MKNLVKIAVAPLAGAWIEIFLLDEGCNLDLRRTPRGCVD